MTDSDTRADFAVAAATPPPADEDDTGADGAAASATIPSAPVRSGFLPPTNAWRGLFTLSLGLTLCAIAVAESTGAANAPAWFLGFAIPVLTEWIGEWLVYGRRKGPA
ncbi:MAG: hypothetical protein M0R22_01500 [Dehalococcoidia bacterium]|jgi:hypothetical protein|nr:hypothetical protein [Dehalococcoidia bacterium]